MSVPSRESADDHVTLYRQRVQLLDNLLGDGECTQRFWPNRLPVPVGSIVPHIHQSSLRVSTKPCRRAELFHVPAEGWLPTEGQQLWPPVVERRKRQFHGSTGVNHRDPRPLASESSAGITHQQVGITWQGLSVRLRDRAPQATEVQEFKVVAGRCHRAPRRQVRDGAFVVEIKGQLATAGRHDRVVWIGVLIHGSFEPHPQPVEPRIKSATHVVRDLASVRRAAMCFVRKGNIVRRQSEPKEESTDTKLVSNALGGIPARYLPCHIPKR